MYVVEEERCNACGICISLCPAGAISLMNDAAVIDQERCSDCGVCFDACLHNSIYELTEPRRIASVAQPMYGRESACFPPERTSRSPVPAIRIKPGAALVAAFPVLLKLIGSLADHLSARSRRGSDVCRRDSAVDHGGNAGHQGRHLRRGS